MGPHPTTWNRCYPFRRAEKPAGYYLILDNVEDSTKGNEFQKPKEVDFAFVFMLNPVFQYVADPKGCPSADMAVMTWISIYFAESTGYNILF